MLNLMVSFHKNLHQAPKDPVRSRKGMLLNQCVTQTQENLVKDANIGVQYIYRCSGKAVKKYQVNSWKTVIEGVLSYNICNFAKRCKMERL